MTSLEAELKKKTEVRGGVYQETRTEVRKPRVSRDED